jgi:LAO/AO transport system kinase
VSSMRIFEMHGHAYEHDEHAKSDALQRVMLLSAVKGTGVTAFWETVSTFKMQRETNGQQMQRRQQQAVSWMWERIEAGLKMQFRQHPQVSSQLALFTQQVLRGDIAASTAARKLLIAGIQPA